MRSNSSVSHFVSAWVIAAVCLWQTGCGNRSPADSSTSKKAPPAENAATLTGPEILDRMIEAYQTADSYADSGDLYFVAVQGDEVRQDDAIPFSVTFERPNKLALHMFGAMLICDGETIRAAVVPFGSLPGIPGQVLENAAPAALNDRNLSLGEPLAMAMNWGMQDVESPALKLLLSSSPTAGLAGKSDEMRRLEDGTIEGSRCFRVELTAVDAKRTYWIDQKSFVLRRAEIESDEIKSRLDPGGASDRLFVRLDLRGARLGGEIDPKAFAFEVPAGARRLRHFVLPIPVRPSRIGDPVGPLDIASLGVEKPSRLAIDGKPAVLTFWFNDCEKCPPTIPHLEAIYQQHKDNDQVIFRAINIDKQDVDDQAVRETLEAWGVTIPAARDPGGVAQQMAFKETGAITFLVGPKGKIQGFASFEPDLGDAPFKVLGNDLERLLKGEDVAAEVIEQFDNERAVFEAKLAEAAAAGTMQEVEVHQTPVAKRSEPKNVKLTKLWTSEAVKQPGGIMIVERHDAGPQVFVIEQQRSVVEVSTTGELVAQHQLPLPEKRTISFLRTATDKQGSRYFLAAAPGRPQFYVLDETWKEKLAYPKGETALVGDVAIGDVDSEGQPELIAGFWGVVGLQRVSLDGERHWSNRSMGSVLQLALVKTGTVGLQQIWCATTRGAITPVDQLGRTAAEIRIPQRAVTNLAATDFDGDGISEICALSVVPGDDARIVALGLNTQGQVVWSYEMPRGYPEQLIDRIVPVRLSADDAGWLLPGVDGSIHLLTIKGQPVEHFNYGAALSGLDMTNLDGKPVLIVSSSEGLSAWKLEPRE